jgi:hypothetical protein
MTPSLRNLSSRRTCLSLFRYEKPFWGIIQACLSCMPKISFADSPNSRSVMLGRMHPRNIQGPDKDDRRCWGVGETH